MSVPDKVILIFNEENFLTAKRIVEERGIPTENALEEYGEMAFRVSHKHHKHFSSLKPKKVISNTNKEGGLKTGARKPTRTAFFS